MRTIKTYFKRAPFYNALIRSWPAVEGKAWALTSGPHPTHKPEKCKQQTANDDESRRKPGPIAADKTTRGDQKSYERHGGAKSVRWKFRGIR
jgi:hypothetical protein